MLQYDATPRLVTGLGQRYTLFVTRPYSYASKGENGREGSEESGINKLGGDIWSCNVSAAQSIR
jgi:hypothetical protein